MNVRRRLPLRAVWVVMALGLIVGQASAQGDAQPQDTIKKLGVTRGVVAVVGYGAEQAGWVVQVAKDNQMTIYFQSPDAEAVNTVADGAEAAGLLGTRVFVQQAVGKTIELSDNLADGVLAGPLNKAADDEVLRALRPRAVALIGKRKLTKPVPEGIDDWSHPYHGPDNNPQSTDQLARGEFHTQFIGYPKFSPMPEQSVIAGGRIFKAMGHIAHKANQNAMLNTLLCVNAYNGTILWTQPLPKGFMIHRNTMIATEDALYMGDHDSCKVIDAGTGKVREEITIPKDITDGPTWKWMAMRDGVLYALVGHREVKVDTVRSTRRGMGHWPWGMWQGHDYKDPSKAFGFGRTVVAIDLKTKKIRWHHRAEKYFDARGLCMNKTQLFCYSPGNTLTAIKLADGKPMWETEDKDLLTEVGKNERAQHYVTGYATSCYAKCTDDFVLMAGPQRSKLVAISAKDGKLAWSHPDGNLQMVLRKDGIYAAGPKTTGVRLDYATGKVLGQLPTRRACTRATGTVDSIFYRTRGGTVRVMTESRSAQHIAPMRPPCQDGVLVSNGHLYWGPWMCGCQLSLYGNIGLGPAKLEGADEQYANALTVHSDIKNVAKLNARENDWNAYRGNNARSDVTGAKLPAKVKLLWTARISTDRLPTAPVAAGGMVFLADRSGTVRALDQEGKLVWKAHTGGPFYYPPALWNDRAFVGSADGRVYCYEAKSGRLLWTFRVAPLDRRILVYGELISRWPVSGGVVVQDGVVYAAAGITHYDGTYLAAIDALTGKVKASNTTSGKLSPEVNSGISMQGNVSIHNGELRFLGGGVYETARYDLKSLQCLNQPVTSLVSRFRTAFYPLYPNYGKFVSLEYTCNDGRVLNHDSNYEGLYFSKLALQEKAKEGAPKQYKDAAGEFLRRKRKNLPEKVWEDKAPRRFTSFVVTGDVLLGTGQNDQQPDKPFLVAINVKDGSDLWVHPTPAGAVKGGTAVDHDGRIYISLQNGQLLCFVADE